MSEVVNFENLTTFLNGASLHEIYRISVALSHELEDPRRIAMVKDQITVGQELEYFDGKTSEVMKGMVVNKGLKYAVIQNNQDSIVWKVPYHMLKVDAREFDFTSNAKGLNKNELQIGSWVGFNHDGYEVAGCIERLNQKTVSIRTKDNYKWRVSYGLLYHVIEGEQSASQSIRTFSLADKTINRE